MITFLLEDIIDFHNDLEQNSIVSAGIRDKSLIESAVNAPFQTFDNMELYPTVEEKAAHLFYGLVKNHRFIDGNKRVAVHAMFIYLSLNYIFFDYTVDEMEKLVIGLADGSLNADDVVEWIYNKEIDNRE